MRGCIVKRGKHWALVVELGRDTQTGKRRQKWYAHKTRGEAEAHLTQVRSAMQGGAWTPPAKIRFGDFAEQRLRDYAAGAVGPVTLRNYRTIIRDHLTPKLGHVPLDRLSAQAIQGYLSETLQKGGTRQQGLHPNSVHKDYRVLREILGHAVRWGLLSRNPAELADPPKQRQREVQVWDEEQVRLFLAEAKRSSRYYPLYLTAILTGMRQGELCGLRWKDVDLTAGVASVRQTFTRLGREQLFKEPKTKAAQRAIALPPAVVETLRTLHDEQKESRRFLGADYQDHDLVFCQPDGKPLHAHNVVRRDFRSVVELRATRHKLEQQGMKEPNLPKPLPRITFHDLRHAHASYLARAGVPAKVAQERLGHATPHFTMQVYTHTLAGQQEAAALAVEGLLLGRS
jgi:integrase